MRQVRVSTGYKPHKYQLEIHRQLKRFSVVICHRRFGKTILAINELIDKALKINTALTLPGVAGAPKFGYIAPFLKQGKAIAWEQLKAFTANIPNMRRHETELWVEFPHNGARIQIIGADNAEALRGGYFDGVVCDEPADFKLGVWSKIIRPMLADRNGWVLFIGTPKGLNELYELYTYGLEVDNDWVSLIYPVTKTIDDIPHLTREEIEDIRQKAEKEGKENEFRQEFLCDFTASTTNTLIPIDSVLAAAKKSLRRDQYEFAPVVLGVDVARFGDDSSCIVRRQGLAVFDPVEMHGFDTNKVVGHVVSEINKHNPDAIFIDAGRGEGVIDGLRGLGYEVFEIPFGGNALNTKKFTNKRSEMWYLMAESINTGLSLPTSVRLQTELTLPTYSYDSQGRIVLEKKKDIKERSGGSPDRADALALTYAMPVQPRSRPRGSYSNKSNEEYDPWK